MNCNTCGAELEEGAKFCPKCGNPVGDNVAAPVNAPVQTQTTGLAWANFLCYFALWAGAVINTYNAISFLTGLVYASSGVSAETVYDIYGTGLMVMDKVYGVIMIGAVVVAVIAALSIIKRKAIAGKMVCILYAIIVISDILYVVATTAITGISTMTPAIIGNVIMGIVMIIVNTIYFNKRKHIFVN